MAEKNFLSWVGFKGEEENTPQPNLANSSQSLERIRELEAQLKDLKSRRDITALTKEEFEILATETAMSMIKTAQQRETRANQNAERILNESKKVAATTVESAEAKAKSTLAAAESRGRKYIEAAEADAADIVSNAESEAESLITAKKREASAITSTAKREAEQMVQTATTEIAEYRSWLSGVMAEAERLYKIQTQSLDAAESAINQSRQRLESAFNRFSELQQQVEKAIRPDGTPTGDSRVVARIAQASTASAQQPSKKKKPAKKRR